MSEYRLQIWKKFGCTALKKQRQWQTCDRLVKKKKKEITKIIVSPSSQIALQKRPKWNEIERDMQGGPH